MTSRHAPTLSVGDIMRRTVPTVPPELVPSEEVGRLAAYGDLMPARLAPVFGYEFRLSADPRVDTAYALTEAHAVRAHFEALVDSRRAGLGEHARDKWERILGLLRAWSQPETLVARGLRTLMLEFDSGTAESLPVPLLFWHDTKAWSPSAPEHLLLLEEVLRLVGQGPPETGLIELASRAFQLGYQDAPGVEPIFGVALSREPRALRVQLAGIPPETILPIARVLKWGGSESALGTLLERIAQKVGRELVVAFDLVDGGALPRVGIEFIRTGKEQRLGAALDFLRESGHVERSRAEALAALGEDWQWYMAGDSERLGRRMSHYKLNFVGDRAVEAKGYLKYSYGHARQG
ncbi:hypothetical protein P2318_10655 [Myxococcaceae bacterium GXIMD 01537]